MSSALTPDCDAALAFLEKIHPGRRRALTSISVDKKKISTKTFDSARSAECRKWLEVQGRNATFTTRWRN